MKIDISGKDATRAYCLLCELVDNKDARKVKSMSLDNGTLKIYDSVTPRLTVNETVHRFGETRAYSIVGAPDEVSKFLEGMENLN